MKAQLKNEKNSKINTPIVLLAYLVAILLWVFISLSYSYQVTIGLPFRLVNLPNGVSSTTALPELVYIKLKATGWKLLSLQLSSGFVYQVSASQIGESGKVSLRDAIGENTWMTDEVKIIDINPEEIRIDYERTVNRVKKVGLHLDFSFRDGYGFARAPIIDPETVQVYGSRKLLGQFDSIFTEKFKQEDVDKSFSEELILRTMNGVQIVPEKVRVYFDVQKIIENRIESIPIEVLNVPPDRKVVLSPAEISIGVKGGIEYLGKLKIEDCRAYLEYRDIIADSTGSVEPHVTIPGYIQKVYIEPQRIKTIIKKF